MAPTHMRACRRFFALSVCSEPAPSYFFRALRRSSRRISSSSCFFCHRSSSFLRCVRRSSSALACCSDAALRHFRRASTSFAAVIHASRAPASAKTKSKDSLWHTMRRPASPFGSTAIDAVDALECLIELAPTVRHENRDSSSDSRRWTFSLENLNCCAHSTPTCGRFEGLVEVSRVWQAPTHHQRLRALSHVRIGSRRHGRILEAARARDQIAHIVDLRAAAATDGPSAAPRAGC